MRFLRIQAWSVRRWPSEPEAESTGIVGDSLNPGTDAIRRSAKVRWVHVRHEETAAFAAGAEAQLTGRQERSGRRGARSRRH